MTIEEVFKLNAEQYGELIRRNPQELRQYLRLAIGQCQPGALTQAQAEAIVDGWLRQIHVYNGEYWPAYASYVPLFAQELVEHLAGAGQAVNAAPNRRKLLEPADNATAHPKNFQDFQSPWKRTLGAALLGAGPNSGYQRCADWISEHCPDAEIPAYFGDGRVDVGLTVRKSRPPREQFKKDLSKVKGEMGI